MNITEDNKREPVHLNIDFYINEDHQWFLVDWIEGEKSYRLLNNLTAAEFGELIIKEIQICI